MDIKQILIFLGVIILLTVLAYSFRKAINLTFIRIVYGHYSYEFLSKYKKYFVRSPFQYCFKDDFVSHLLDILSKQDGLPSYKSAKEIHFAGIPYFISFTDFLRKRGNPHCFNAFFLEHLGFGMKALGYLETVAGSRAITVFYFMNDSFFMGEYIFKNPKTDIKASLVDQFLDKSEIAADNFYIENTKNRIIHYQNKGVMVDIRYLNKEDQVIVNNLKEYFSYMTGKKLVIQS